jgi:hypothetical protein
MVEIWHDIRRWKSAKWVAGLTLLAEDQPGSRERSGYHDRGDPWLEQRYQGDLRQRRTTATGPDDYAYLYAVDVGRDGGAVTADAAHIVSDEMNGNQADPAADLRISTAHVDQPGA